MDRVTYSRNVFIPVTDKCRNKCSYCGFRAKTDEFHLLTPEDVRRMLNSSHGATEALFTFGEKPDVFEDFRNELGRLGYSNFIDYVADLCKLAVKMGFLPHTNAGILAKDEMKKLRRWNASMGLMLETTAELEAHSQSPGKKPELRIKTIETAGKLKIPFTTGILVGIGEGWEDRKRSLMAIRELHEKYGHIQEVIIQNFKPKPGTEFERRRSPSTGEMVKVVRMAREILPEDITIQVPPNLTDFVTLIRAGARDIGGISSVTPDYINPEAPWPDVQRVRELLRFAGFELRERLPIYPGFVLSGWYSRELEDLIQKLSDEEGYRKCCPSNRITSIC